MSASDRAVRDTFVKLADTLVAEFDVIDFLDMLANQAVELLGVSACGVMLADNHETLNVVAASSERARLLELFQLQNVEGPCLECYHTGTAVECLDLGAADGRWPRFAPAAREGGFTAVEAIPMRLREQTIGAMNLFAVSATDLGPDTRELGRALADVATIGILHERAVRRREVLAEQLQGALESRVLIEQAKGVMAERHNNTVSEAFNSLRGFSRSNNMKLALVARKVVDGELVLEAPAGSSEPPKLVR